MKRTMGLILCALFMIASFSAAAPATGGQSSNEHLIAVPGSSITLKLWDEPAKNGELTTFYEISKDGKPLREAQASYELGLRYAHFDPLKNVPAVEPTLAADENTHLFIVQFVTQPLVQFEQEISQLGGHVRHYIAQFAYLVEMDEAVYGAVEKLPYVRWIGPYHPAYRLEEQILQNLDNVGAGLAPIHYNIQVLDVPQKAIVADRIAAMGALVNNADAGKFLVEATLNGEQLMAVARWDEVNFIDTWGPYESDMDIVRQIGGANFLETVTGFSGEDVRGEVFDEGFTLNHQEFQAHPLITHGTVGSSSHGTATSGINFAYGVNPQARGLLPDGQGIVATYQTWGLTGGNRHTCSMQLLQSPYFAVFQTASVGSPQTSQYTTISAEADAYCFDSDLVHCQSQSNMGNQNSRPQAWAKNMVSGGGIYHYNTLDRADDMWNYGASIGPASDGRIKPTFTHFYDQVFTTYSTSPTGYGQFSGTSSATPIIAGHIGLFYQMWDAGIFGNTVIPGGSVFENRCHPSTAKAMLIASAYQYPFTGTTGDKTRTHQGWGMPDLQHLYNVRNNMYIIDESDILVPFEIAQHQVTVDTGAPELKVVMVYADPPGNPAVQTQHRINDLTLKVTSPSGTVYWGNRGLYEGVWSTTGGSADTKNTEECVFIQNPAAGQWTIEVQANEIIQDSHRETPEMDADYALVVSGVGTVTIPNVTIALTPINPPIVIPASGGSFNYNVLVTNNESSAATFDAWTMAQLPNGSWFGPALGPINLTLSAGATLARVRTQSVPASAPSGTYTYEGRVGTYPSAIWDSDSFTFVKSTTGDGAKVEEWLNSGESFDPYLTPTAWAETPTQYRLAPNYPNPFNPTTTLEFKLPQAGPVHLAVYDLSGRLVSTLVDGYRSAGVHKITFDGSGLASGIYLYQLEAGAFAATGKMVLMK